MSDKALYVYQVCVCAGADPGFLEWGFIRIKVWGFTLLFFILFFLNFPMKME